jgi:2-oxoisovalerate dehydrogenase E1 component beta subunit
LYLKPKALLRVRGEELIPGEPDDEKELKAMIDAPIGDRSGWQPRWPKLELYEVPIGKGKITRFGDKLTLVSYARTLLLCNKVADTLKNEGIEIEVIDMRSLYPYDWQLIKSSIEKTKRVIFVNEDKDVTNFAEHLAYRTVQELFYILEAKPKVIAGANVPGIGLHPNLEDASVPQLHEIEAAARELLAEVP